MRAPLGFSAFRHDASFANLGGSDDEGVGHWASYRQLSRFDELLKVGHSEKSSGRPAAHPRSDQGTSSCGSPPKHLCEAWWSALQARVEPRAQTLAFQRRRGHQASPRMRERRGYNSWKRPGWSSYQERTLRTGLSARTKEVRFEIFQVARFHPQVLRQFFNRKPTGMISRERQLSVRTAQVYALVGVVVTTSSARYVPLGANQLPASCSPPRERCPCLAADGGQPLGSRDIDGPALQ